MWWNIPKSAKQSSGIDVQNWRIGWDIGTVVVGTDAVDYGDRPSGRINEALSKLEELKTAGGCCSDFILARAL